MKLANFKQLAAALALIPVLTPVSASAEDGDRLITIGPGVTEIVYALKNSEVVVGTDVTSRMPQEVNTIPKVGYHRRLSSEGMLSLKPDHLIGTEEMGPEPTLSQMKQAGIKITSLPAGIGLPELHTRIDRLSEILGNEPAGEKLWQSIKGDLQQAKTIAKGHKPLKVVFLMAHTGTAVLAGNETTVNNMIEMAGGENPVKSYFSGFRPVSGEALLSMAPDLILVARSTMSHEGSAEKVMKLMPGLEATPAGRSGNIFIIDGATVMGGLGPRIGIETLKLAKHMYQPEA